MPEHFRVEAKDEIAARRLATLSKITSVETGKKRLMLLIAEYKELQHTQYGHNFIAKHMPDIPLLMDDSIFNRFSKAFNGGLQTSGLRAGPGQLLPAACQPPFG